MGIRRLLEAQSLGKQRETIPSNPRVFRNERTQPVRSFRCILRTLTFTFDLERCQGGFSGPGKGWAAERRQGSTASAAFVSTGTGCEGMRGRAAGRAGGGGASEGI